MKLETARVTNFKCIDDSGEMKVDQVTCLVGKNESGKTSLLQALYRLNPDVDEHAKFARADDYPRRFLTDFDERHPDPKMPPTVIDTTWELEAFDRAALIDLVGPAAEKMGTIRVTRGYGNYLVGTFELDEAGIVAHLVGSSELHDEEKSALADVNTIPELRDRTNALNATSGARLGHLNAAIARLGEGTGRQAAWDLITKSLLPRFVLFSQYNRMPGRVQLQSLHTRVQQKTKLEDGERTFLNFCAFAGTSLDELASITTFESLVSKFEGASSKITSQIFKYWSQNRFLRVLFSRDAGLPGDPPPFNSGNIFNVRIRNELHDVSVPFDERSTGFVWFFSFLVYFSQVRKTHGDRLIILLDEPGLSLHARAQRDLLRYFDEQLAPKHQVLFTTHSPFMIPPDLMNARTVEDQSYEKDGERIVNGTKVSGEILSRDKDTIFPLQAALGYEITQSLFISEHTLLVEGPSDLLYLRAFSDELKSKSRTSLDPRWVICPVEGVDKISAFLSLFGGNNLHVAVFIDYASGQKAKVDALRRSALLQEGHVFTAEAYANQSEADTEDIIGGPNYITLVNSCYGLGAAQALNASPPSGRITKFVEEKFRLLPPETASFDHFTPSSFFIEKRAKQLLKWPDAEGALERFEKLFADLNKLLPGKG